MTRQRRRLSRFRKRMGATPKFLPGNQCGEFNILEYIGYTAIHPVKHSWLSQEHHWYKVRCSCGTSETHTQQQLTDKRRLRCCENCRNNVLNLRNKEIL